MALTQEHKLLPDWKWTHFLNTSKSLNASTSLCRCVCDLGALHVQRVTGECCVTHFRGTLRSEPGGIGRFCIIIADGGCSSMSLRSDCSECLVLNLQCLKLHALNP